MASGGRGWAALIDVPDGLEDLGDRVVLGLAPGVWSLLPVFLSSFAGVVGVGGLGLLAVVAVVGGVVGEGLERAFLGLHRGRAAGGVGVGRHVGVDGWMDVVLDF